jgi:hypothetical protein
MAKNKTQETELSVNDFILKIEDETKRNDAFTLLEIFEKVSGLKAKLWGPSIIGFGSYHYKYESGHEGDAPILAFSPRAAALTLYLSAGFEDREPLLAQLGKHKASKGCLYIKKLADIDMAVFENILINQIEYINKTYPS